MQQKVRVPTTDYEVTFEKRDPTRRGSPPPEAMLKAIVTWLSNKFELPRNYSYPSIKIEAPARIAVFHYFGVPPDDQDGLPVVPPGQRNVVSAYDPRRKTIYLPDEWTGNSPADLSVLVHEMVHHLQHLAGLKFECVNASEALAYAAQDKWLSLFGRDLATDFDIDGFTLLVRSRCYY